MLILESGQEANGDNLGMLFQSPKNNSTCMLSVRSNQPR